MEKDLWFEYFVLELTAGNIKISVVFVSLFVGGGGSLFR